MLGHHHPDQLALLRDKPELIPCAVDVELSGVRIPAGATVVVLRHCANRDEALLAEPDRLDVTGPRTPRTSRSATAPATASARRWGGWSCKRRSPPCCGACPGPRPAVSESELTWKLGVLTVGPPGRCWSPGSHAGHVPAPAQIWPTGMALTIQFGRQRIAAPWQRVASNNVPSGVALSRAGGRPNI